MRRRSTAGISSPGARRHISTIPNLTFSTYLSQRCDLWQTKTATICLMIIYSTGTKYLRPQMTHIQQPTYANAVYCCAHLTPRFLPTSFSEGHVSRLTPPMPCSLCNPRSRVFLLPARANQACSDEAFPCPHSALLPPNLHCTNAPCKAEMPCSNP